MPIDLINDYLHLRYKPSRKNFQDCLPCPAFELFDWVLWTPDSAMFLKFKWQRPRNILCLANPKSIKTLVKLRRFLKRDSVIVIAGEDTNLSAVQGLVAELIPHCKEILFEAKDIEMDRVKSFSMGFISYYLMRQSDETISRLRDMLQNGKVEKHGVLASWGGIWKKLDDKLDDRKKATKFVEESSWLKRELLEPDNYWLRLAESDFLLSPAGQGVQAPKLAEAWLMHTVPVVTSNPCFRDLQAQGYPLLIIDRWEDLNPNLLEEQREIFSQTDWHKINYMLTLDYFNKTYICPQ